MQSDLVPGPVPVTVLTPPKYKPDGWGVPLLLLLHGGRGDNGFLKRQQMLFERAWRAGTLPPLVVATPDTGRSFYLDGADGSGLWESFIMTELLAELGQRYRINPDRLLAMGTSMGGMGALRMAFKFPDRVTAVVALEPAIEPALALDEVTLEDSFYRRDVLFAKFGDPPDATLWRANNPANLAQEKAEALKRAGLAIYLEVGDEDCLGLFRGVEFLHRILYDAGVTHEYRLVRGANHVGRSQGPRIANALDFIGRVLLEPWADDPAVAEFEARINAQRKKAGL